MRKFAVTFMFAVIAGSALTGRASLAQDHVQKYREDDPDKTPAQIQADRQAARDYQRSVNSVPDKKPVDPWGIARPEAAAPKAPAKKTAAPKPVKPASSAAN